MKKALFVFVAFVLFSCSKKKNTKAEIAQPGDATVFAIYTNPDSTKTAAIMFRRIVKSIAYDSVKKKEYIALDTLWGVPKFLNRPFLDSAGKAILDSTGKPIIDTRPTYFLIKKDSVRWRGVEGVSMDSLLKKSAPLK